MDQAVKSHLEGIKFGAVQGHRNMAVCPVFSAVDGGPHYMTMKEAMAGGFLSVTEVSAGGAVPELKVVNSASVAVLILDGEELAGAKQNRIVNTTILLRRQSETIIPVSCTEQGRWSYVSDHFDDSGHIATHRVRGVAKQSVSASLKAGGRFQLRPGGRLGQRRVRARGQRVASPTGAMKDAFEYPGKGHRRVPGEVYLPARAEGPPCPHRREGGGDGHGIARDGLRGAAPQAREELRHGGLGVWAARTGRPSRRARRRPSSPRPWRARASASSPWATAGTSASRGRASWARPSSTTRRSSTRPSSASPRPRRRATWRASPAGGGSAGEVNAARGKRDSPLFPRRMTVEVKS